MTELASLPEITVGSRLFHVGAPGIPAGSVLSDPYFGSKQLNQTRTVKTEEAGRRLEGLLQSGAVGRADLRSECLSQGATVWTGSTGRERS